jgi:uroporphyrinogen-III synthase
MRLLITRPEIDAQPLRVELSARGHDSLIAPLLEIEFLADVRLDLTGVQALVITSANGARALDNRGIDNRGIDLAIKIFAVGDASARACRALGFSNIASANGDVSDLAALISRHIKPQDGPLLHVAGTKVAGDLAGALETAGISLKRVVLYRARIAATLPPAIVAELSNNNLDGALFFSPRTARSFVSLLQLADLSEACNKLTGFCLSQAVAHELRDLPWRNLVVAEAPNQSALLAAIAAGQKNT